MVRGGSLFDANHPKSRVILVKVNVRVKWRESRKASEIGRRRQGGFGSV